MNKHNKILNDLLDKLKSRISKDDDFKNSLLKSLKIASKKGQDELNKDLYKALKWPTTIEQYFQYLISFAKMIPHQDSYAGWKVPKTGSSYEQSYQEVTDKTHHFYFLINQPINENNDTLQDDKEFINWLRVYHQNWGSFLNTDESFNNNVLLSFLEYSPQYDVEDSLILLEEDNYISDYIEWKGKKYRANNASGWLTFNQFFARRLNTGCRPIAGLADNSIIVSPADCNYMAAYDIGPNSEIEKITIKYTHKFANINDLLKGSKYSNEFKNGKFIHYYLSPFSYHRFHIPVNGKIADSFLVRGKVYYDVSIEDNQFKSTDNAENGYEFAQQRGVAIIDTKNSPFGDIGLVAVIPVAMAQVSSVTMLSQIGKEVVKGEDLGYFLFGGSDIILLFQEGKIESFYNKNEYIHYGQEIAKCKI